MTLPASKNAAVLVVRPGALGDAVLTLPLLHALRAARHSVRVLGTPASWRFLAPGSGIEVLDFGSAEWLALHQPGAALDTRAQAKLEGVRTAIVFLPAGMGLNRAALASCGIDKILESAPPQHNERAAGESPHAAHRLLEPARVWLGEAACAGVLAPIGAADDPLLRVSTEESARAREALGIDSATPLLALHPGSGGRTKCWPVDRYARLAAEMHASHGLVALALFGPAEEERALRKDFARHLPKGFAWHAAENLPLRTVAALLGGARAYAGNDSGVTHLAAHCCPTLALFGPTDPRVWRPIGRNVRVAAAYGAAMEDLALERVREALQTML
ncbi:MAG: glycosyltransferase family 9 protein [Planctomycetes bacterium]|nr:glycosyltransferase family 9 protein [Planctomycetota bacterium]